MQLLRIHSAITGASHQSAISHHRWSQHSKAGLMAYRAPQQLLPGLLMARCPRCRLGLFLSLSPMPPSAYLLPLGAPADRPRPMAKCPRCRLGETPGPFCPLVSLSGDHVFCGVCFSDGHSCMASLAHPFSPHGAPFGLIAVDLVGVLVTFSASAMLVSCYSHERLGSAAFDCVSYGASVSAHQDQLVASGCRV